MDGIETALRKACDWVVKQIAPDGRLTTPSTELWTGIANDLIHTYVLPPLAEAGELLGVREYGEAARFVLSYYKQQETLVPFNRLSHFHAYAMEALYEWERSSLQPAAWRTWNGASAATAPFPAIRTWIGFARPVWPNTPSSGTLGNRNPADLAIRYLEKIQNRTGGFYGSYGKGAKYIPGAEISWAVKYFLTYLLKMGGKGKHA
jgi:malonyl-CoA O-methyltransferase